jgi:hypothetical protein
LWKWNTFKNMANNNLSFLKLVVLYKITKTGKFHWWSCE